jgi:hypothetical protein
MEATTYIQGLVEMMKKASRFDIPGVSEPVAVVTATGQESLKLVDLDDI